MQKHQADTPKPRRRPWPSREREARRESRSTGGIRTLRRCSLLALGLIAVTGALASSASAAVPGLKLVNGLSESDSSAVKGATANCPIGKRVLGAGVDITGPRGQVLLDDVTPNAALTSVRVEAREDQDGTASKWAVRAYAICANPVAGLERRIDDDGDSNSNDSQVRIATCSPGKQLLGMGGDITGGFGEVGLGGLVPSGGLTSNFVDAQEDQDGTTSNWRLRAYAICANPVAGLERRTEVTAFDSLDTKRVDTDCSPGKRLLGASGGVGGGGAGEVVMDFIPSPTSVGVRGSEDQDGNASGWFVRGYAICASP